MSETLQQAHRQLEADGIRFVQIEASEFDGALRDKLVSRSKGLSDDVGFCTTLLTSTTADDVYEAPFASFEGGFRDFFCPASVGNYPLLALASPNGRGDLRHVRR